RAFGGGQPRLRARAGALPGAGGHGAYAQGPRGAAPVCVWKVKKILLFPTGEGYLSPMANTEERTTAPCALQRKGEKTCRSVSRIFRKKSSAGRSGTATTSKKSMIFSMRSPTS